MFGGPYSGRRVPQEFRQNPAMPMLMERRKRMRQNVPLVISQVKRDPVINWENPCVPCSSELRAALLGRAYHLVVMNLVSLLSESRVLPDMTAATLADALEEMVAHLVGAGDLAEESHRPVVEALAAREERVSTGIGHGVAIPHCYSGSLRDPVALLGRSRRGIDFDACDDAPVHFVILLIVPENQPNSHLQTLALIARLFSKHAVREKMTAATSESVLLEVLKECELELD